MAFSAGGGPERRAIVRHCACGSRLSGAVNILADVAVGLDHRPADWFGPMQVLMTKDERALFGSYLRDARRYLEFGSGGSTVLASSICASVVSVDSSREWLDRVQAACRGRGTEAVVSLMFADIGEVGEWGYPRDSAARHAWPGYYSNIWSTREVADYDLCLVDGRFRVACAAQAALNMREGTVVLVHDYNSRPIYHAIGTFMQLHATVDDIAAFVIDGGAREIARQVLQEHGFTVW